MLIVCVWGSCGAALGFNDGLGLQMLATPVLQCHFCWPLHAPSDLDAMSALHATRRRSPPSFKVIACRALGPRHILPPVRRNRNRRNCIDLREMLDSRRRKPTFTLDTIGGSGCHISVPEWLGASCPHVTPAIPL